MKIRWSESPTHRESDLRPPSVSTFVPSSFASARSLCTGSPTSVGCEALVPCSSTSIASTFPSSTCSIVYSYRRTTRARHLRQPDHLAGSIQSRPFSAAHKVPVTLRYTLLPPANRFTSLQLAVHILNASSRPTRSNSVHWTNLVLGRTCPKSRDTFVPRSTTESLRDSLSAWTRVRAS